MTLPGDGAEIELSKRSAHLNSGTPNVEFVPDDAILQGLGVVNHLLTNLGGSAAFEPNGDLPHDLRPHDCQHVTQATLAPR